MKSPTTFGLFLLSVLWTGSMTCYGQHVLPLTDSTVHVSDSSITVKSSHLSGAFAMIDSLAHKHSPRKAALYSAVLPGLGQAYNHQYIKIPLMYAGIGVATGFFIYNFNQYRTYRDAYRLRLNGKYTGNAKIDVYSLDDIKYLRDGYRQYVDYSVLGFAGAYLYNVLDALVFAHLYKFDISNDLGKLRFGPVFHQQDAYAGIGFTFTFTR